MSAGWGNSDFYYLADVELCGFSNIWVWTVRCGKKTGQRLEIHLDTNQKKLKTLAFSTRATRQSHSLSFPHPHHHFEMQ
jgi:hypothetical protein